MRKILLYGSMLLDKLFSVHMEYNRKFTTSLCMLYILIKMEVMLSSKLFLTHLCIEINPHLDRVVGFICQ